MSSSAKRKADDTFDVGAGPRKAATIAHGWADLPAELVLRIGRLHDEPRDLVIMERTCRSWRKVVIEGDSNPQVLVANAQSLEERMQACLWRDLALMIFPALPSIVKALQDKERKGTPHSGHLTGDAKAIFSWKSMYRSQHCVAKLPTFYSPRYCPKTSVDDYIFSYEFRRHLTNELLFVTSGRIDEESPQLWYQEIIPSNDGELPKLKGPADPRLIALLGDDPFSETKIRDIDLRVVVTRISDMKAVELSSLYAWRVNQTTAATSSTMTKVALSLWHRIALMMAMMKLFLDTPSPRTSSETMQNGHCLLYFLATPGVFVFALEDM